MNPFLEKEGAKLPQSWEKFCKTYFMEGMRLVWDKKGFQAQRRLEMLVDGRLIVNAGLLRAFNTQKGLSSHKKSDVFWFVCMPCRTSQQSVSL